MPIAPGTYPLDSNGARLIVRTGRTGGAAKAGHDLTIEVTSWRGQLVVEEGGGSVVVSADGGSLQVREGTGGMTALDSDDRDGIRQTIDEEVLKRTPIEFRSTSVRPTSDSELLVEGELELLGATHPVSFELSVSAEGRLTGTASIRQTDWGIKPYSTLFGALKVADEVQVTIDGALRSTTGPAG